MNIHVANIIFKEDYEGMNVEVVTRQSYLDSFRKEVSIRIPLSLNFEDEETKSFLYASWRKYQNVGKIFPEIQNKIEELKKSFSTYRFEMSLVHNPRGSFLALGLLTTKPEEVTQVVRRVFGNVSSNR